MDWIPFNKPYMTGKELFNIAQAHFNGVLAGDGPFTKSCQAKLELMTGAPKALLTHSCTAALEMAALLCDLRPGDEVIMPSFTFVSTANAVVLRGAKPVFADIDPFTLNIDPMAVEQLISSRTRAICVVHYAGGCCDMGRILELAALHGLLVIEDAAQAITSTYQGRSLGALGDYGALSFHETKNIIAGEGGALLVNSADQVLRSEIIREKGTNRTAFLRGQVDKYSWVDIGSSFLPGEVVAAFLSAQLDDCHEIIKRRMDLWLNYHAAFAELESIGWLRRPIFHSECQHNAHMYYLLLRNVEERSSFIEFMKSRGVQAIFHYVPLHSSEYSRCNGLDEGRVLPVTDLAAERLVRLPLWVGMESFQSRIIQAVGDFFDSR